ncbi:MAG: caspase family protein [Spirochaetaceae bacterium]|nr:caspase family protein [Spirochaetaceae bacterium]
MKRSSVHTAWFAAASLAASLVAANCALPEAPRRFALVYGVTDYPGTTNDLTYPAIDATEMTGVLGSSGWMTQAKTNSAATKAAIQADIGALSAGLSPDSSVLVYFSGHGTSSADTAYFIPYDGLSGTASCISLSEIKAWFDTLPCRNKILILDTCYSGGFVDAGSAIDTAPQAYGPLDGGTTAEFPSSAYANFSRLLELNAAAVDSDLFVLSAAGSRELSYESSGFGGGNGVFTSFLIGAASNADADKDKLVTLSEAYSYASLGVTSYWNAQTWNQYNGVGYADFLPHLSGQRRDVVLFDRR